MTAAAGRRATPVAAALLLGLAGCTSVVDGQASPAPVTLEATQVADFPSGQLHTEADVEYPQTPPVGGEHDPQWADCTGSVYAGEIRPENAVHSLEHGAVWVTYDPELVDQAGIDHLADLVDGRPGLMLSPWPGQGSPVSLQAWNHQLRVPGALDAAVPQFINLLVFHPDNTPELGASCENPAFLASPRRPD